METVRELQPVGTFILAKKLTLISDIDKIMLKTKQINILPHKTSGLALRNALT